MFLSTEFQFLFLIYCTVTFLVISTVTEKNEIEEINRKELPHHQAGKGEELPNLEGISKLELLHTQQSQLR